MIINVEDFCRWVNDISEMDFKDKCMVHQLVNVYGSNYSLEEQTKSKSHDQWESWLDSKIQYCKDDISKGLPTSTYNAIMRGAYYEYGEYKRREFKTNRDLDLACDNDLEELRNMSKNKVAKVREYIEANRKRIFGEKYE